MSYWPLGSVGAGLVVVVAVVVFVASAGEERESAWGLIRDRFCSLPTHCCLAGQHQMLHHARCKGGCILLDNVGCGGLGQVGEVAARLVRLGKALVVERDPAPNSLLLWRSQSTA